MLQSLAFKSRSRTWLLSGVALLLVLIMSSCCPPALVDRIVEKNAKAARGEKANP
ncbi:hypothetical protein KJ068_17825 [bacterium]|nr:hypothetical protein [bacterium]